MDIEKALEICVMAHAGQTDKQGEPYILHPLRMAFCALARGLSDTVVLLALLHDVLEDTKIKGEDLLAEGMLPFELDALKALTRQKKGESYERYLVRVKDNFHARSVKLLDLEDNLMPRRVGQLNRPDLELRYKKAKRFLLLP